MESYFQQDGKNNWIPNEKLQTFQTDAFVVPKEFLARKHRY
jgi:hypothetical protein